MASGGIARGLFEGLSHDQRQRATWLLREGGFRSRVQGPDVELRGDPQAGPFLRAKPLQSADGSWREDAEATLRGAEFDLTADQTTEVTELFRSFSEGVGAANPLMQLQVDLWTSPPLDALRRFTVNRPDLRCFRIVPTKAFHRRHFAWRLLAHHSQGNTFSDLVRGAALPDRFDGSNVYGHEFIHPALFLVPPLVARNDPVAAVFNAVTGAQIIVISEYGAFERYDEMCGWPVAVSDPTLLAYQFASEPPQFVDIPPGYGVSELTRFVRAANGLIAYLTDPGRWVASDGAIDTDEQAIAWSSVRFGLGAITELAVSWNRGEAVWTAFRALGILQGIWEAGDANSRFLDWMVDPATLRAVPLKAIQDPFTATLSANMIDEYERELQRLSGASAPPSRLRDLRNLVHGTGARTGSRAARLRTLRDAEEVPLQALQHVASLWWTAVVLAPEQMLAPRLPGKCSPKPSE